MLRPLSRTLCAAGAAVGVTLALLLTPSVGRAEPFFWDFLDGDWLLVQISRAASECREEQAPKDAEPPATTESNVPPCEMTRERAEREQMQKALIALNLKLTQVSAQAAAYKKQLDAAETRLKQARARMAEMEKKAREETSAITEPKPDLAAMDRRMKEMDKKIDQLVGELATLRSLQQAGFQPGWTPPPVRQIQPPEYPNPYPYPVPHVTPYQAPSMPPHLQPVTPPTTPDVGPYSAPIVPLNSPRF
jgi:uncharacterized coiled-coil protein SlyX